MINKVYQEGKILKKNEGKYLILLAEDVAYEADSFMELAAVLCGLEYQDCEMAETAFLMRVAAAKMFGMAAMAAGDLELMDDGVDEDEIDEDEDLMETIIMYHEVIGKIPYSYTGPEVDYAIHGRPGLIRVECDETFIYSLIQNNMVAVMERTEAGDYARLEELYDIDELMEAGLAPFKEKAKTESVPPHMRLTG